MSLPLIVAVGAIALLVARFIITSVQNYRFSRAHGCKEALRIPQSERIIGYANFKEQGVNSRAKKFLPAGLERFKKNGDTFSLVSMGRTLWFTREPENVKAVLATNFKDFGIGPRYRNMGLLLGQGIFTSDGALWEHSRVGFILLGE